jgi:hypothetical protein
VATIDLDAIQVAKPCPADWEAMEGDDRVRFCGQCRLNVYDLSALTSDEARALLEKSEGRVCVRFFRRRDGRILTRDCPVGVRTVRRRRAGIAAGLAAAAGFGGGLLQGLRGRGLPVVEREGVPIGREVPLGPVMGAVPAPRQPGPPEPEPELTEFKGDVALPGRD